MYMCCAVYHYVVSVFGVLCCIILCFMCVVLCSIVLHSNVLCSVVLCCFVTQPVICDLFWNRGCEYGQFTFLMAILRMIECFNVNENMNIE